MTTDAKTYSSKFNARRGAHAALGDTAVEGRDFEITKAPNGRFAVDNLIAAAVDRLEAADAGANKSRKLKAKVKAILDTAAARQRAAWKDREAAAEAGKLPEPPDFSSPTHAGYRTKLQTVVDMAKAGNLRGLKTFHIEPTSSSRAAIARYRDLCVRALTAQ